MMMESSFRGALVDGFAALAIGVFGAWAAADRQAVPPLKAPADGGPITVAFVLSEGAVVIDFAGPWEVFQDAATPGSGFQLYTVSATKGPIRTSGGMQISRWAWSSDTSAARPRKRPPS